MAFGNFTNGFSGLKSLRGFLETGLNNILATVMTNIVVDKSKDNAEPLSICFLQYYSTPKKVFISERDQNHDTKKVQALSITFSQYDWFSKMGVPDWLLHCVTNRAVYTRENNPRLTLAAAYIIRERNYLHECKLPGQDKPRLEKAVNVDFVPFIRGVCVLCKPRHIFSRINGPNGSKLY